MELIISIIALIVSLLVAWIVYVKIKSVYLNLYNMSKGLDVLWENQQKIVELTKIKGFVQLTNEELEVVHKEVTEERTKLPNKVSGIIRPSNGDKIDKKH
jgi:hypothetical protein